MTGGNKGSLVKEDKSRATRQRINVDIALASKNSKAANTPTGKLPEGRNAGKNIIHLHHELYKLLFGPC